MCLRCLCRSKAGMNNNGLPQPGLRAPRGQRILQACWEGALRLVGETGEIAVTTPWLGENGKLTSQGSHRKIETMWNERERTYSRELVIPVVELLRKQPTGRCCEAARWFETAGHHSPMPSGGKGRRCCCRSPGAGATQRKLEQWWAQRQKCCPRRKGRNTLLFPILQTLASASHWPNSGGI